MKTLIIVIGLLSFANAKAALQPNADAMQALLEASADIRILTAENKEGVAYFLGKSL